MKGQSRGKPRVCLNRKTWGINDCAESVPPHTNTALMQKEPIQFGTLTPEGLKNQQSIHLDPSSPDPLAYAYGLFHGRSGHGLPEDTSELAPEYIRGVTEGLKEYNESGTK
jgi:hypothetical protein